MRILVLTYMDPVRANSAASITLNRLLAEWYRRGHDVTLFYSEGIEDYCGSDEVMAARLEPLAKYKVPSVEKRLPFRLAFAVPRLAQLPDRSLFNHFRMTRAIAGHLRNAPAYDFILSWSFRHSIHLAARRVAAATRKPWFVYLSDPWADNGTGFGDYSAWELAANRYMERKVVASAAGVFFTTEAIRRLTMRKYPASWLEKSGVNVTGYDPTLYPERTRNAAREISVRYVGSFYGTRSPEPLMRALGQLAGAGHRVLDRVRFRFVGADEKLVRGLALQHQVPAKLFEVVPAVSYVASLAEMRDADLLLSIDAPGATNMFLPSKLVDYVGSGNPIWAITPAGAAADFVKGVGGVVSDIHDPEAVARDLVALAARPAARFAADRAPPDLHVARTSEAMLAAIARRTGPRRVPAMFAGR